MRTGPGPGIINGGIYVLKREILDLVHDLPCSLEQDVFPVLVERGEIRGHEFDGYFLDIGLPETLEQGHRELPRARPRPAAVFDRSALVHSPGAILGRRRFNGRRARSRPSARSTIAATMSWSRAGGRKARGARPPTARRAA